MILRKLLYAGLALLFLVPSPVNAAAPPSVKIFYPESYAEILKNNEGKEFTLVFWSTICSPCLKELKHIGEDKLYKSARFVFVAVDGDDVMDDIKSFISKVGLQNQEHWVFKRDLIDDIVQTVDESWYGVVPRNYFFDDEGNRIHIRSIH